MHLTMNGFLECAQLVVRQHEPHPEAARADREELHRRGEDRRFGPRLKDMVTERPAHSVVLHATRAEHMHPASARGGMDTGGSRQS